MNIDPWHVFTANVGMMPKPYTAFVTLLDIILLFVLTFRAGLARGTFKVEAPNTDGPSEYKRIFRAHANTVEQLVMHFPLLWIAAFAMDDVFAASFGVVWTFSRILYARGYYRKAKGRMKGFFIGLGVNAILLLGALAGVIASF